MAYPAAPTVTISVDGKALEMPATPVRSTNENGYLGNENYEVTYTGTAAKVTAKADNKAVKIEVTQPDAEGTATVKCDYNGVVKVYTVKRAE